MGANDLINDGNSSVFVTLVDLFGRSEAVDVESFQMVLQLHELGLRGVGGHEDGLELELFESLLQLLGRPLQARDLVAPRVQVVAAPEVNGDVRTAQWCSPVRL